MAAFDLSGSWRGHYEHGGGRHGIEMKVAQHGASFAGEMRDEDTLIAGTCDVSDDASEPAFEMMTSLPDRSVVEGEIAGDRVTFVKRYLGAQRTSGWNDGEEFHLEVEGHRVLYAGRLDAQGEKIRGQWRIPSPFPGERDEVGAFELHRGS